MRPANGPSARLKKSAGTPNAALGGRPEASDTSTLIWRKSAATASTMPRPSRHWACGATATSHTPRPDGARAGWRRIHHRQSGARFDLLSKRLPLRAARADGLKRDQNLPREAPALARSLNRSSPIEQPDLVHPRTPRAACGRRGRCHARNSSLLAQSRIWAASRSLQVQNTAGNTEYPFDAARASHSLVCPVLRAMLQIHRQNAAATAATRNAAPSRRSR